MKYRVHVYFDGREVPNHKTAIANLNRCDPRLLIEYRAIVPSAQTIPNRLHGAAINSEGDAI